MPEFFENNEMEERVILVGVSSQDGDDTEDSLDELEELVKTAGAVTVGRVIQNRQTIHPGLYIGSGKVEELLDEIAWTNATGIVCDDELSPAQLRNLSDALNVKVMDRTLIILDIFAARASTSEGKIQVELAQLRYRMSRLSGIGKSMSRLILDAIRRRSTSNFFSPGPLVPIPPPSLDILFPMPERRLMR